MANVPTWDPTKVEIQTSGIFEASDIDRDGRYFVAISIPASADFRAFRTLSVTVPETITAGSTTYVNLPTPLVHPLPYGGSFEILSSYYVPSADARAVAMYGVDYLGRNLRQFGYAQSQTKVVTNVKISANQGADIPAGTVIVFNYRYGNQVCLPYSAKNIISMSYSLPHANTDTPVINLDNYGVSQANLGYVGLGFVGTNTSYPAGTLFATCLVGTVYGIYGAPLSFPV